MDDDAVQAAVIYDNSLLAERVKLESSQHKADICVVRNYLYLVDGGKFQSCFADFFEMLDIAGAISVMWDPTIYILLLTNWIHPPT